MAISPINFFMSAPVKSVAAVERVKRRTKAETKAIADSVGVSSAYFNPTRAAQSPEERASDSTQEALQNIRLGG